MSLGHSCFRKDVEGTLADLEGVMERLGAGGGGQSLKQTWECAEQDGDELTGRDKRHGPLATSMKSNRG